MQSTSLLLTLRFGRLDSRTSQISEYSLQLIKRHERVTTVLQNTPTLRPGDRNISYDGQAKSAIR